ncbi:CgeB family protein [Fibrella arboris]|uniref:CgeB family protein n=1 Tax=Fibrella arboris TaxID=3242486 RepID=UPI00351FB23C
MTVLTVGTQNEFGLEASYRRGLETVGIQVRSFDIYAAERRHVRIGKLGALMHRFMPVDSWRRKANRELAMTVVAERPDLVLVFCNSPILFSTLAFVRSLTSVPFVLIWPDPLLLMEPHVQQAAPFYDGVATYSNATVPVFKQMGFRNVQWLPFGADLPMHHLPEPATQFSNDIGFIGAWRPEREQALAVVAREFRSRRIAIWGTSWNRCEQPAVRKLAYKRPLRGKAYAEAFNQTRINLNVIDEGCMPAANMRFFEIPIAHGLQVASSCPEFSADYVHQQQLLYYANQDELITTIEWALTYPERAAELRREAYAHTLAQHTYAHRAQQLIRLFLPALALPH